MQSYAVISIIANDRPVVITELAGIINEAGCSILESRMSVMGTECALVMMLTGPWNALAKLETTLPQQAQQHDWICHMKRTEATPVALEHLPFDIQIVAIENPGIVFELSKFLTQDGIGLRNLSTSTYHASYTGALMFSLGMTIILPRSLPLGEWRDRFLIFCDELNLDISIEPSRN